MLPLEMKKDKDNLFYLNSSEYLGYMLPFYNNNFLFFEIVGVKEFVVKYYNNNCFKEEENKNKEMLLKLLSIQEKFDDIDFPIGYYKEGKNLKGTIVRYYDSPSLKNISDNQDINSLFKYFYYDDDSIHNLFKLFIDILGLLEHLFNEKIYYTDVHPGNFVFANNQVKLIDFDYRFVLFNNREKDSLRMILLNYINLIYIICRRFGLGNLIISSEDNFDKTKSLVKKLEDKVRKECYERI